MWCIYTMKYYFAVKFNNILIMISHEETLKTYAKQKKPVKKATHHVIPLIRNVQNHKYMETESDLQEHGDTELRDGC